MKKYIGVLDSGVGGLSVLSQLVFAMKSKNYIFFGDTKNMPYGTKTPNEIFLYTKKILEFFEKNNVSDVVFACNTTSAVAYDELKECFKGRLNIFPLIQKTAPYALENLKDDDTIAVLATKATVNSKKYEEEIKKINPKINVVSIDCTGFVEIVENRLYEENSSIKLIKSRLDIAKEAKAKKIILGCTHYPYLEKIFKSILDVEYFNPAVCMADVVKRSLNYIDDDFQGEIKFFVSKNPKQFILSAKMFFDVENAQLIEL